MRLTLSAAAMAALALCACVVVDADMDSGRPSEGAPPARTLTLELSPPADGPFRVENLAGTMTVLPGTGDRVVAVASIHAGSDELASLMKLEEVAGEDGEPVLRVIYPLDRHRTYRYGAGRGTGSSWLNLLGGGSSTGVSYAGEKIRVADHRGVPLYADVEIRLPARDLTAVFVNHVGEIHARDVRGDLRFSTTSGDQFMDDLTGRLHAGTASGDVNITSHDGSVECSTASGDVTLTVFDGGEVECTTASGDIDVTGATGERILLSTASGDIVVNDASVRLLKASTASGDVQVLGGEIEEFDAGTASGDVVFSSATIDIKKIEVGTGHGDVALILNAETGFEVMTDLSHGQIENEFEDAEPILEGREVVGYRRGDGRVQIEVSTGNGDLALAPHR
jgi:hypothetical protein